MFVIFEGLDKAGKGTLEWEFMKATNFKHVVVDRGPVGYMVFDKLFNRQTVDGDYEFMKDSAYAMNSGRFMVVYCKATVDVAMQRIKENGETCPYDYEYAQLLYDAHIDALYDEGKVVEIDTSKLTVDECIFRIKEKLKEVLKGEHN